jgi:peptide/nickel transport system substrate-binding protein
VNKRGDIAGGLATHWTVGGDRRSIRFTLREGVTWHDGKPFTAADVVFTIRAAQDPKTLFSRKRAFDFIADAEAVEPHVVEVTFKRPMRDPARRFLFKIVPAHAFKSTGVRRTARFSRRPIGTGPYRLSRYGARKIELVVHEAYWNPAKIPAVEMQHVPDKASQLNLLKFSGKRSGVQAVVFIPPKNVPLFENSDTVVLETYHTVSWWYLAFNQSNRNLKAPAVREAIALAIDREALRSANLGQGDILSGPFVESSPFYNFEVDPREQDLARARRLLDEAGFVRRGKVRRRGRRKLVFTLVIDKDLPAGQELALGLQAQLRQIGVVLKPRFVDHARYREQVFKQRRFDLTMNVWSFEALGDIRPLFHSTGALNFTGFEDDEVDRLLDAAQATDDYKKYKRYYKQLHVRLHETLPYAFLWSLDVYSGINKQVRDVFIQPYYYFTSFETWGMR